MKLLSIQTALFPEILIDRPDLTLNSINESLNGLLDDMPNILNLPLNAPPEIPLVQAKSKDNHYNVNISRNRIDLLVNIEYSKDSTPSDSLKNEKTIIDKYIKSIQKAHSIMRVGIVLTMFAPINENVKAIYDKYMKESFIKGTTEATIRTNKQNILKNYTINNIRSIEAVDLHVSSESYKGVIIQLDTNNVPVVNQPLSTDFISSFFLQVLNKIKENAVREMI